MSLFFKNWSQKPSSARPNPRAGVALLLVMSILAALSSISFVMFNIAFSQIQIAGELSDSFIALYAADEGIERLLYEDRVDPANLCSGFGSSCHTEGDSTFATVNAFDGGCYYARISKTDLGGGIAENNLEVTGQSFCAAGATRFVRRAFELIYTGPAP